MSVQRLINTIKIAENWAEENAMTINKKKSKIMVIGEQNTEDKKTIARQIKQYEITNNYKSLGIVI